MDQMSTEEKNTPEQENEQAQTENGGLLDKITDAADTVVDAASDVVETVAETAGAAVDKVSEVVGSSDDSTEPAPASAPETPAEEEIVVEAAPRVVGAYSEAEEPATKSGRNERKTRDGIVVSNKMDKTIAVSIERRLQHPIYGKYVKKSKKLIAHDESNQCQIGDVVRIMECRPLSRRKRWRLVSVLEKAK
jgi:ribosomal protein uS17